MIFRKTVSRKDACEMMHDGGSTGKRRMPVPVHIVLFVSRTLACFTARSPVEGRTAQACPARQAHARARTACLKAPPNLPMFIRLFFFDWCLLSDFRYPDVQPDPAA
jgi:hypothetical protein